MNEQTPELIQHIDRPLAFIVSPTLDCLPFLQVNAEMMKRTGKDTTFMHCLPAERPQEVTDEVTKAFGGDILTYTHT